MVYIIKESGEKERFNSRKILNSSIKAGASKQFAKEVSKRLRKKAYNGIKSKEIFKQTLGLLRPNVRVACRYRLKEAIMELGPSGFPFEGFFARILEENGFSTQVGIILQGNATSHEVDIVAKKQEKYMIECKFHNKQGIRTDTKVAMYTYARFLDLKNNLKNKINYGWLVTNTKCTNHAMEYSKGVGLKVTGWSYSTKDKNLQELIEEKALYPITILNSIKGHVKEKFFKARIFLAKDLLSLDLDKLKRKIGIEDIVLKKIISQSEKVCDLKA